MPATVAKTQITREIPFDICYSILSHLDVEPAYLRVSLFNNLALVARTWCEASRLLIFQWLDCRSHSSLAKRVSLFKQFPQIGRTVRRLDLSYGSFKDESRHSFSESWNEWQELSEVLLRSCTALESLNIDACFGPHLSESFLQAVKLHSSLKEFSFSVSAAPLEFTLQGLKQYPQPHEEISEIAHDELSQPKHQHHMDRLNITLRNVTARTQVLDRVINLSNTSTDHLTIVFDLQSPSSIMGGGGIATPSFEHCRRQLRYSIGDLLDNDTRTPLKSLKLFHSGSGNRALFLAFVAAALTIFGQEIESFSVTDASWAHNLSMTKVEPIPLTIIPACPKLQHIDLSRSRLDPLPIVRQISSRVLKSIYITTFEFTFVDLPDLLRSIFDLLPPEKNEQGDITVPRMLKEVQISVSPRLWLEESTSSIKSVAESIAKSENASLNLI